ncbi:CDP-glycerol glycerophosphotransferase family protein [Halomonas sp. M4R5S39]|uniref:CDP-glycerol glycerophosphotransferase family protein n=1 Tax=Halomonas kalidii TaxID=3043293 RepID=UPI0024A7E841|nr:CDP-glycerol glycerophosphotransferase family protein [Halomonas kalidii]MDI5985635.1 CDP-glycerol glycerophosphotransferase family protein [Halomonas kalidii]
MTAYLLRLLQQLLWLPLCPLAWLMPRDASLWVFGAWYGRQYADNARYLYRHVCVHEPEVRAVWLAHDHEVVEQVRHEGGEAALAYSLSGILISLRARLFLVTHSAEDVNAHASLGGLVINLTHGTPLKRFGRDARSRRFGSLTSLFDRYLRRALPGKRGPDHVLVASGVGRQRMMSAYGLPAERVTAVGYPRWDAFRLDATALLRGEGIEPRDYNGILLYAPTLRKQGRGGLDVAQGKRLEELLPWLEREGLLLLIRGHVALKMTGVQALTRRSQRIVEASVDRFPDVNALLPEVDVLITDYSSLMFDYACLKRPIILMAPDLDDYLHRDVGIYGDYFDDAPGPVIADWSQLPDTWAEVAEGHHDARLAGFTARHAALNDGRVCERMTSYLRARSHLPAVGPT